MAYETQGDRITQLAGEDLTGAENLIVRNNGTDDTVIKATADTAPITGVLTQGKGSGGDVTVQISGVAKVKAGAAVTAGAIVTADATGRAVAVSATVGNRNVLGQALESAGAAGVLIPVAVRPGQINTAVS